MGEGVFKKLCEEQGEINLIENPDERDKKQKDFDSKIPKCFMSNQLEREIEKGLGFGLHTDRTIKNESGDEVYRHTYLYPARANISVAKLDRYALCEMPENGWQVCTYQFKASAESIDLPDVPESDLDAACLLLQCIISSSSIATEERFLAAWLQYFIAYHCNTFNGHPNWIVSIGDGIVAELFVKAAELRAQQNYVPYPTPELDCLIACAHNFIERSQQLLILHFRVISSHAIYAALKGEGASANESQAAESLRKCSIECLTSWGHEISHMEVSVQSSLMLLCFCSPPVIEEEIYKLITNPLHHDIWTFELDGTN